MPKEPIPKGYFRDRRGRLLPSGKRSPAGIIRRRIRRHDRTSKTGRFLYRWPASSWQPESLEWATELSSGTPVTIKDVQTAFSCGRDKAVQILHFLGDAGLVIRRPGRGGSFRR